MPVLARLTRPLLTALPMLAALAGAAAIGYATMGEIRAQRAAQAASAEHQAQVLATILTEHVQRSFEQADVVAKLIADRVAERGFSVNLAEMAREGTLPLDLFVQVGVTDAKGVLRASTVENFKPIDLSDRAHIRVHLADPAHGPYISKPLLGRASGRWSLQYSRAVQSDTGVLRGVVVISLDPSYFSAFHQKVDIGTRGMISLIGTEDRVVRTQRTGTVFSAGHEVPANDALFHALRGARHGTYESADAEGGAQYVGYDSLNKYPLVLTVAFDRDEFLARSQGQRDRLALAGSLLAALLLVLGAGGSWALAQNRRWVGRAQRAELRSTQRDAALDATLAAIPVGVLLVDAQGRVTRANASFVALTGLDEADLHLAHLQALLDRWCDAQQFDPRVRADTLCTPSSNPSEQRVVLSRRTPPEQRIEIRAQALGPGAGHLLVVRDLTYGHTIDQAQTTLVTVAAHELRGPIARIEGFVDLLAAGSSPSKRIEITELLRRQSLQLRRTFDDLIDLAELELNGDRKFHYERLDLRDVAATAVNSRTRADELAVQTEFGTDAIMVMVDQLQFGKAVQRLLEHAARQAVGRPIHLQLGVDPAHGVATIVVKEQKEAAADDDNIVATAEGPVHRLQRAEPPVLSAQGGLVLSLIIAIVEMHDGQVYQSSTSRGPKVRIELPLSRPDPGLPPPRAD